MKLSGSTFLRRVARTALFAAPALLLSACMVGPDFSRPAAPASRHYDLQAERAVAVVPLAHIRQRPYAVEAGVVLEVDEDGAAAQLGQLERATLQPRDVCRKLRRSDRFLIILHDVCSFASVRL